MRKLFFYLAFLLLGIAASAQQKQHRIVYDITSSDTSAQSAVLRQFKNVLKAAPDAQLELVCHGQSVNMMVSKSTVFEDRMKELSATGKVFFKVCANSMKRMNIDKNELVSLAVIVPVAILELSEKQMEGWSYIKAD